MFATGTGQIKIQMENNSLIVTFCNYDAFTFTKQSQLLHVSIVFSTHALATYGRQKLCMFGMFNMTLT